MFFFWWKQSVLVWTIYARGCHGLQKNLNRWMTRSTGCVPSEENSTSGKILFMEFSTLKKPSCLEARACTPVSALKHVRSAIGSIKITLIKAWQPNQAVRVAFEIDRVERVEIHCSPNNKRSASIPKKLGFTHQETKKAAPGADSDTPLESMIWTLVQQDYPTSPAAQAKIQAYDVVGRQLI
jgi:hypothetical protein